RLLQGGVPRAADGVRGGGAEAAGGEFGGERGMSPPLLSPALPWRLRRSEFVTLWHGCTERDRIAIENHGISLKYCRVDSDFGRGFYTTTLKQQAKDWAWIRYTKWLADPANKGLHNKAMTLRFDVRRYGKTPRMNRLDDGMDRLASLHFVLGNSTND